MIETEERKINERKEAIHEQEERDRKAGKLKHKAKEEHTDKAAKKPDKKENAGGENKEDDKGESEDEDEDEEEQMKKKLKVSIGSSKRSPNMP